MIPLSSSFLSPQFNLRSHTALQQRSGADWSSPKVQKEIAKLTQTDNWKNYEKGFKEAAKRLRYTDKASWKTRLEALAYWVKNLWVRLRSDVMGMIRGIRFNHKHIMNRFMPGIQDWIHKELKTQNRIEMHSVRGRSIPVHFTTFELPKPKSPDGAYHLALFGDPGFQNSTLQMNVDGSIALAKTKGQKIDAVILTGDVLYATNEYNKNNARRSSGDSRSFWSNVGAVYNQFIKEKVPIFTAIGNNDADQGHTDAFAKFMSLPRYFNLIAGDVEFFFVDETIMSAADMTALDKLHKTTHYTQTAKDLNEAQLYWLDKALRESKQAHPNRKRILVKHFPMVSSYPEVNDKPYLSIRHGSFDKFFENEEAYGLSALINGHEHHFADTDISYGIGKDGVPVRLKKGIPQLTLGSGSHAEQPPTKAAYMYDWQMLKSRATNTLMLHEPPSALFIDTGFGMLDIQVPSANQVASKVWMNFIKPPTAEQIFYQGSKVAPLNPGDDVEHPDCFRLLYRRLL